MASSSALDNSVTDDCVESGSSFDHFGGNLRRFVRLTLGLLGLVGVSAKGVSLWANAGNFNDEASQPGESIAATSEGTLSNSRVRSLFVRGVVMLLGFSVAGRSRSQEGRRRSPMKNVNDDFAFRVDRGG